MMWRFLSLVFVLVFGCSWVTPAQCFAFWAFFFYLETAQILSKAYSFRVHLERPQVEHRSDRKRKTSDKMGLEIWSWALLTTQKFPGEWWIPRREHWERPRSDSCNWIFSWFTSGQLCVVLQWWLFHLFWMHSWRRPMIVGGRVSCWRISIAATLIWNSSVAFLEMWNPCEL